MLSFEDLKKYGKSDAEKLTRCIALRLFVKNNLVGYVVRINKQFVVVSSVDFDHMLSDNFGVHIENKDDIKRVSCEVMNSHCLYIKESKYPEIRKYGFKSGLYNGSLVYTLDVSNSSSIISSCLNVIRGMALKKISSSRAVLA